MLVIIILIYPDVLKIVSIKALNITIRNYKKSSIKPFITLFLKCV